MREIKFRAKCKLKDKLMFGSYRLSGGKHYINSTEIYRETLGQFTGFKDKNGVDVYEGDIIQTINNKFVADLHYSTLFHLEHYSRLVEVIGNIYETPDLFVKKKLEEE